MSFAHPALAVLSACIFLVAFFAQRLSVRFRRRNAFAYSHLAFMTAALCAPEWPGLALDLTSAAACALMVAAAAAPSTWISMTASPDIAICLDTSGSMSSRDIRPSRALAAAEAVRAFAALAPPRTRIGLVSFAGAAQRIVAPSNDRRAMLGGLARVPAPNGQTAIGDGLTAAAAMLPHRGERAIVLITDGANNHGEDPRAVVRRLADSHIRLDVVAIANSSAERELRTYAAQTGGVFARAGNVENLNAQFQRLASREFTVRSKRDCTAAVVVAALVLGAAAWLASAGPVRL